MKFLIEKIDNELYIKAMVGNSKRMLKAVNAEQLISAMGFLEKLSSKSQEQRDYVELCIEKVEERAMLEEAIGQWLAKGNQIRVIPRVGEKIPMNPVLKTEILDILSALGLEGPEGIVSQTA